MFTASMFADGGGGMSCASKNRFTAQTVSCSRPRRRSNMAQVTARCCLFARACSRHAWKFLLRQCLSKKRSAFVHARHA